MVLIMFTLFEKSQSKESQQLIIAARNNNLEQFHSALSKNLNIKEFMPYLNFVCSFRAMASLGAENHWSIRVVKFKALITLQITKLQLYR